MIEFKFPCPSCGQRIQATDAYSGRQINCPACQRLLVVPQAPNTAPAKAAAMPPPMPAPSAPAASKNQRPPPPVKKSKTKWIIIGSTAAVMVIGAIAFVLFTGVFSHSGDNSQASKTTTLNNSKGTASPNMSGPSVAEILQKVTDQYASLTNYTAAGTALLDMDMSKVDMSTMPGMNQTPANKKKAKQLKDAMANRVKTESTFSVKLGRPGYYLVQWENLSNPNTMKGAAWSVGEGDFLSATKNKYTKMDNRDIALASATGLSGGMAGTMPSIFFNDASSQLNFFNTATRGDDETTDGEDCYVLNGNAMGMKAVLWVTKDKFLIKQKKIIFGDKSASKTMTDAQMDDQLKKMPNLSAKDKAEAKKAMKDMKPMIANMKGSMTETYRDIQINTPLKKSDFNYDLPAGAVLTKTLY